MSGCEGLDSVSSKHSNLSGFDMQSTSAACDQPPLWKWGPQRGPACATHAVQALTALLSSVSGARDLEAHSVFPRQQHDG